MTTTEISAITASTRTEWDAILHEALSQPANTRIIIRTGLSGMATSRDKLVASKVRRAAKAAGVRTSTVNARPGNVFFSIISR